MRAIDAWLIDRPMVTGLVAGIGSYLAYIVTMVCIGRWHGWVSPLFVVVPVVFGSLLGIYFRKLDRGGQRL